MDVGKFFRQTVIFSISGTLAWGLTSCSTVTPTHQTSIQQMDSTLQEAIDQNKKLEPKQAHASLPRGVDSTLLPPLSHYVNRSQDSEPRFDVTANNLPARDFFMGLIQDTKYNMVVSPNVKGTISLKLKNVTIVQALDAVRDIYGYDYTRTSYGYEVMQPQMQSQIFHMNYLDVQRTGKSYIELTTGEVSSVGTINVGGSGNNSSLPLSNQSTPGAANPAAISTIETKSEIKFWKDIEKSVQNLIGTGDNRSVTVTPSAGIIAVRAYPAELRRVSRFLDSLQTSLNRQVILEAKILEVQLDDEYQAGIDWAVLNNTATNALRVDPVTGAITVNREAGIGQGGTNAFEDTDLKQLRDGGIFALRFNGNFNALVRIIQTQGNVQVLSSPHISTINNQKAVIKVGQDEFFVTGVSTSNTIIGTNTLPSQNVSLTPFFSGITLDVTPEINSNNEVILHIHPSISKVREQTKTIQLGSSAPGTENTLVLPLARSTIRESDNIVRARNGQVVVIGGLMTNNMSETIGGVPGISKVPYLGTLFRRTEQIANKSELVILLRPVVATNKNFIKAIEDSKQRFQILKRPFHVGGLQKEFGNEGEREDDT